MKLSELSKALRSVVDKVAASKRPNRVLRIHSLEPIFDKAQDQVYSLTFIRPLANLSKEYVRMSWDDANWIAQVFKDLKIDIELQDLQDGCGDYVFNEDYSKIISSYLSRAIKNKEIGGKEPLPARKKEILDDLLEMLSAPAKRP